MESNLETLLGGSLSRSSAVVPNCVPDLIAPLFREREERFLLSRALWIFGLSAVAEGKISNLYWGESSQHSPKLPVAFAADAFGDLFAVDGDTIVKVETETGQIDVIARSLEEWASIIINDPDVEVGERFLREWEHLNRSLTPGERLHPRVPFILGGGYEFDNVVPMEMSEILRFRAELARQTADLPDGSRIILET